MYRLPFAAAASLALSPTPAAAQPITPQDLRGHIEVLASDAFEGRRPGTEGEQKTIGYIAERLAAAGFGPAAADGGWYQAVPLVERRPLGQDMHWRAGGKAWGLGAGEIALIGGRPRVRIAGPVVYGGHGLASELAGLRIAGAVVLVEYDVSAIADAPGWAERSAALVEAGAAAVIAIPPTDESWPGLASLYRAPRDRLQGTPAPAIEGAMARAAAARLIRAGGAEIGGGAARLDASVRLDVATRVRPYASHNVIGRLRGTGAGGESILYLGHWDHLGLCRPAEAADRICNGAVDNASGIALLIEVGERLARGARLERDVVILATTAEEAGLLGARHFAQQPPMPLRSIVAAMNVDTVAIHPRGEKLAVIGRGHAPLDAAIEAVAQATGRTIDRDREADAFAHRQDGWELAKVGVPSVMVGGSFSNMTELGAFLSGPYHKPDDDLARPILLDGAAEDADFLVALGRRLADRDLYRATPR